MSRIIGSRAMVPFTLLLGLLWSVGLQAQNNSTRSPYTRYGFGEVVKPTSIATKALGGVSQGIRNPYIINSANPASYTAVDSLTFLFDFGVSAGVSILREPQGNDSRLMGNFEYLRVMFPVGKYLAMSGGIEPYARRGYVFGATTSTTGDAQTQTDYTRRYSGAGDYSKLYLGLSGKLLPSLSLGINGTFLFGSESRSRQVFYLAGNPQNPSFTDELSIRAFSLDLGAQYHYRFGKENENQFVVGLSFTPTIPLRATVKSAGYMSSSESGTTTALGDPTEKTSSDTYKLPMQLALGSSLSLRGHYLFAVDLAYRAWNKTKLSDVASSRDEWSWAAGFQWIPNSRSRAFFDRVAYRVGFNGANSYFTFPVGNPSKQEGYYKLGASLGFGLPVVDRRSQINLSIDYSYLMPSNGSLLKEHYIGLSLGLMFNEAWFRRARVD